MSSDESEISPPCRHPTLDPCPSAFISRKGAKHVLSEIKGGAQGVVGFYSGCEIRFEIQDTRCKIPHRASRITDPIFHILFLATPYPASRIFCNRIWYPACRIGFQFRLSILASRIFIPICPCSDFGVRNSDLSFSVCFGFRASDFENY